MMLDISLGLGLCWSPREVYSNTSEGIHHHCQQQQQQSKSKQAKNFFMSFSVDCRQKVWPRLRVNFPTSNDPIKITVDLFYCVEHHMALFCSSFSPYAIYSFLWFHTWNFFSFSLYVCYSCVFLKAACLPWIALVFVLKIFHRFWEIAAGHSNLSRQCLLLGLEIYHSMVSWLLRLLMKT